MIKGAILDVDGTILDSMGSWHDTGVRYLASIGIEAEPGLGDFLFTQTNYAGAVYMVDHYHLDKSVEEVAMKMSHAMDWFYFESPVMKEGARELLDRLEKDGVPMTVATSTDRYLLDAAFEKLDLSHYFKAVLSCVELGTTKCEPLVFYKASEVMNTDPGETWVFEDGLYAVKTAKKAGFRTVAVYDEESRNDWDEMVGLADEHVYKLSDFSA